MRFEERELKPYSEPVSVSELVEGSVYFSVTFADDDMRVPIMETLVFVGEKDGYLCFQDIESHHRGIRYDSAGSDDDAMFYQCSESQLKNVFEYERALDVLLQCSLRR